MNDLNSTGGNPTPASANPTPLPNTDPTPVTHNQAPVVTETPKPPMVELEKPAAMEGSLIKELQDEKEKEIFAATPAPAPIVTPPPAPAPVVNATAPTPEVSAAPQQQSIPLQQTPPTPQPVAAPIQTPPPAPRPVTPPPAPTPTPAPVAQPQAQTLPGGMKPGDKVIPTPESILKKAAVVSNQPQTDKRPDGTPLEGEEKIFAAIGYIGILALVPLLAKRDSEFCQHHGRQGLVVAVIFVFLWMLANFSYALAVLVFILQLVAIVGGFLLAFKGDWFRIPGIYELSLKLDWKKKMQAPPTN
jgi:uncharacterized membrane protein